MKKIYIWGVGKALASIKENIKWTEVDLLGYIDNAKKNQGKMIEGVPVLKPEDIDKKCDYIILAVFENYTDIKKQLLEMEMEETKILSYYDMVDFNFDANINFISATKRMNHIFERKYLGMLNNLEYEIADKIQKRKYCFPTIKSAKEGLLKIINERISLCRFGDGELEIACGREKCPYQNCNSQLSNRLQEILINQNEDRIITGLSDYFGNLDMFQKKFADELRVYLTKEKRRSYEKILDFHKIYYDALMSRPYMMRQDKEYAKEIFDLWKKIWNKRDIVLVEGKMTRGGYGNNLYENARSVKRVLCPAENAWDFYDEIYRFIIESIEKDVLIIISLGPAATVLAYDLAMEGYQAIDLGHIDIEYEWFLREASDRINISYKYVGEKSVAGRSAVDINDDRYTDQIIKEIGI